MFINFSYNEYGAALLLLGGGDCPIRQARPSLHSAATGTLFGLFIVRMAAGRTLVCLIMVMFIAMMIVLVILHKFVLL
ncbi:MAG: hypothetical protein HY396_00845 [Candidatus Doudnabacteria bacterium]|nr:hypothetical protein [Candidatus Doudnabacteria bacterium]